MLYHHCVKPEYTCRFRWRAGSVAFWDNRATLHYALDDYGDAARYAHRVTLRGDKPFGPAMPLPTRLTRLLAAAGLGADLGVAAAAFVGTNVDNSVVTMAMVAGAPLPRAHRIAAGQVVGFAVLVAGRPRLRPPSSTSSPPAVVGLLGLVPLAIGVHGLLSAGPARGRGRRRAPTAPAPRTARGDRAPWGRASLRPRSSPSPPVATTWRSTSRCSASARRPGPGGRRRRLRGRRGRWSPGLS